jgi:hypothetical protein
LRRYVSFNRILTRNRFTGSIKSLSRINFIIIDFTVVQVLEHRTDSIGGISLSNSFVFYDVLFGG